MLLVEGKQEQLIAETTTGAGSTVREGSIDTDSLLATVWINSITSGTLAISVYTLTDIGKEKLLFSFPTLSAGSTELLLRKSGVSLQRYKVVATYTNTCSYEVYIRAVAGAGESSTRILGSTNLRVSQKNITTSAEQLLPASLTDRQGLLVKHWGGTGNLYLAESLVKATSGTGYPLAPRDAIAMDIAAGATIYAVSDSGSIDVRIAESGE